MKWKPNFVGLFLIFVLAVQWNSLFAQSAKASAIKASWIDHFSKFIEWPNISDSTEVFVIAVIGEDELEGYLNRIYDKRTIKDLPVDIKYISNPEDIPFCHILYIAKDQKRLLDAILSIVDTLPVLTIGSTYGYAESGVMINFYNEDNRIKFEFNVSASKRNELEVSFRLLELARIVKQN